MGNFICETAEWRAGDGNFSNGFSGVCLHSFINIGDGLTDDATDHTNGGCGVTGSNHKDNFPTTCRTCGTSRSMSTEVRKVNGAIPNCEDTCGDRNVTSTTATVCLVSVFFSF